MCRVIWPPGLVLLILSAAPRIHADSTFPGVSKYSYFSSITSHLRNPMFHGGLLKGEGFSHHDKSVFFDAAYADLLPLARGNGQYLTFLNVGMTHDFRPVYVYGLAAGVIDYSGSGASFGRFIAGVGIRRKLWKVFDLDLYLQVDYDTSDAFDWQIGGYPIESRWLAASIHALLNIKGPKVLESRSRLLFLGFEYLDNRELDTSRFALTLSRRSIAGFWGAGRSSSWELEGHLAWTVVHNPRELIWEGRVMGFFSLVGGGPRGEARPGIHVNVSYVSDNSSDFDGFGFEIGVGAKQIDTFRAQQLYFTFFYKYSGYFYRYPSLTWGLGLVGII